MCKFSVLKPEYENGECEDYFLDRDVSDACWVRVGNVAIRIVQAGEEWEPGAGVRVRCS